MLKSNRPRRRHQRGTSEQRSEQSTKRKVRYSCMWFLGTPTISILRCPDHPNAESYKDLEEPQRIYRMHENEKKRQYSSRVLDIEHEIFTPLVFTTSGGMSQECLRYHSHLVELIALKKGEQYAKTISWIRAKTSFALLRSALICLRGSKTKRRVPSDSRNVDFDIASAEGAIY